MRKVDRRVNRTRRQLREALFNLILEKGYDAVTVEEITARADVGRTTFYLHYHDKEDLLMESIGELVDDLIEQMARFPMDEWKLERGSAGSAALASHCPAIPARSQQCPSLSNCFARRRYLFCQPAAA